VTVPDRLQEGIYFRRDEQPPPCFRLLLLNVVAGAKPDAVGRALADVVAVLDGLRAGEPRDLNDLRGQWREEVAAQYGSLRTLVGFGRRLWDERVHDPPLTGHERPAYLAYLAVEGAPFPSLPWDATRAAGEADIGLQLTANNVAAVDCAAVEILKLISDENLPLAAVAYFSGHGRPDRRGWLEFHDGVSNVPRAQRRAVIETAGDPAWMTGGTYMAFLRLGIDLPRWRELPQPVQEVLVGREKLTGSPLIAVERSASGELRPVAATPPGEQPSPSERAEYEDPPQVVDPLIEASHIHRANQNRASGYAAGGLRIFRQGYDFLESIGPAGARLGLNFVSFQRDLATIAHLLHLPGWLGDVNFGGPTSAGPQDPQPPQLISVIAGGLYAAPPRDDPFPGAALFD